MSQLEGLSKAILSNPLGEEMETQSYDSSLISEVCSILIAEEQGYALPVFSGLVNFLLFSQLNINCNCSELGQKKQGWRQKVCIWTLTKQCPKGVFLGFPDQSAW